MIESTITKTVRTITDDTNPRIYFVQHRCAKCGNWVDEEDTVWTPNWSNGSPYHMDCAPEEITDV